MVSSPKQPRAAYRPPDLGLAWARWNSPLTWGNDFPTPPPIEPVKLAVRPEPVDKAGNPLPWGD